MFATSPDMRSNTSFSDRRFSVGIIVTLVETEMFGPTWTTRAAKRNRVEYVGHLPLVVNVGAGDQRGERYASAVGEKVTLYTALGAIGRVGTGEVPPFGALPMKPSSEAHSHRMPHSLS